MKENQQTPEEAVGDISTGPRKIGKFERGARIKSWLH